MLTYRKIRILENIIGSLPFTIYLVYKSEFIAAGILNILAIGISFFYFKTNTTLVIPTPFGKKPFEFTIGFRKTFYLFPVAYFLVYIAGTIGNFNLDIFALLLVAMLCLSYHYNTENEFYVWNYKLSAKSFIQEKTQICLLNFFLLSAPIILVLGIFFFQHLPIVLLFFILCYMYLVMLIFIKYASFPKQISIPEGLIFMLSLTFPPLLLVFLPFFYKKSITNLKPLLK